MMNEPMKRSNLFCDGVSRRQALRIGASGFLGGLTLPKLFQMEATASNGLAAKAKSCIFLYLQGGPSTIDMWDMKPDAPAEVRGKFKPVQTNVNGIQICEHFPMMSKMMDKVALIRSLHHRTGATHENGQRWMMTGHDFNADSVKPHLGSVISKVYGQKSELPSNVVLPGPIGNTGAGPLHGQTSGYLGSAHEPFFLNSDPANKDFKVGDLEVAQGQGNNRLDARKQLLTQLDDIQRRTESRSTQMHDSAYDRAFRLLTSPKAKQAFDLNQENEKQRDRYGAGGEPHCFLRSG